MPDSDHTLGEVAYLAYGAAIGADIPAWDDQDDDIRTAWVGAAYAAVAAWREHHEDGNH